MVHKETLNKNKIRIVDIISLLLGFSQAILIYILSSYFKLAAGTENVGAFYLVSYGITLLILINLHSVVRKIGKSNVLFFSIIISIAASFGLVMVPPSTLSIIFLIFYIAFLSVAIVAIDIILESFSTDTMSGRIRGLHLAIMNTGYLLGPFISTRILDNFNYNGIFIVLLVFNSLVLIFSIISLRFTNHRFTQKLSPLELIKKAFKRKDIRRVYYISFVLEFFYALMVIFTPLYLLDLGLSWAQIGIIFTIMLVPFVVLQYPVGLLADKKMGEKELFIGAIIFMGLSTLAVLFVRNNSIIIWSIVLLSTRIGAALIEVLRDSYFYKRIDGQDVDLINFFRTAVPISYIIAAIISTPMLIFFPLKSIFVIVALVVLSALYPAFKLVDNKCEKECQK